MPLRSMALGLFIGACATAGAKEATSPEACPRRLSDADIEKAVAKKIDLTHEHKMYIKHIECKYYFTIYEVPSPPDRELRGFVDDNGNVSFTDRGTSAGE